MNSKKKKIFIYTLILFPTLVASCEIFLSLLTILFNIRPHYAVINKIVLQPFDLNTGINKLKSSQKDIQNDNNFINRHGLVKTIYSDKSSGSRNNKGIAILGNSVAAGFPLPEGDYKKIFVNILEKKLREKDETIDIINLSTNGFNSWQENVQLAKYFNSSSNFNDLPNLKLIASIGGIQGFWDFITLLNNDDSTMKSFHMANGLMSVKHKGQDYYVNLAVDASKGHVKSGLKILYDSIAMYVNRSYTNQYLNSIKFKIERSFKRKSNTDDKKLILNQEIKNFKSKSISDVISKKLLISKDEYDEKKSISIQSIVRNYRSMITYNPEGEFIFIYLPTKFSFSKNQSNISERYKLNNLNVLDFHFLEADFRSSLIKALNKIKNLKVYDLADRGSFDWFLDESHFTKKGHKEITAILFPIFTNELSIK